MYILYTVYTNNRVQCRTHTHTHRKDHTQQLDLNNTCQVATPKKASKNGCRTISCKQLSDSSCPEIFSARCEQKKKQFPEWQRKGCLDKQTCNGVSFEKRGVGVVAMSIDSKQRPHRSQSSASNGSNLPPKNGGEQENMHTYNFSIL